MITNFDRFFRGVVENRLDPALLGRVQVRVVGLHPRTKVKSEVSGMSVDELLWMHVMMPITSASISGVGQSPTGVVEGTHVFGIFLDEFYQEGLILGSYHGIYQYQPDSNYGFADPSGQYPRYVGNDVNTLARGGKESSITPPDKVVTPTSVEQQNLNAQDAPMPDQTPIGDIIPGTADITLKDMLYNDEGIRLKAYWDSEGYPTIGVGHLIVHEKTRNTVQINKIISSHVGRPVDNMTITQQEVSELFDKDVQTIYSSIKTNATVSVVYSALDSVRKLAIENMTFQMGVGGVAKFTKALAHMALKKWEDAYRELLDSTWAKSQSPSRAHRVSRIILTGNLDSYAFLRKGKMIYEAEIETRSNGGSGQSALFKEPESAYNAVYPNNHVYESESGHIQEFDDTPGAERYRRLHPAGTYEEISADGRRVTKIVGEDYLIVKDNRNVYIEGNLNVVVGGNITQYVQGSIDQTVDGSVNQFIRGNSTSRVEGEFRAEIDGNAQVVVHKNADITVDQNLTATVQQNATVNVTEHANLTAKTADIAIEDKLTGTATDIDLYARNHFKVDSGSLTEITGANLKIG